MPVPALEVYVFTITHPNWLSHMPVLGIMSDSITFTEGEHTLWWRFDDELWTRFVYVVLSVHTSDMEIVK